MSSGESVMNYATRQVEETVRLRITVAIAARKSATEVVLVIIVVIALSDIVGFI